MNLRGEEIPYEGGRTLEEMEKIYIHRTLEKNNWNRKKTAEELGIDQSTLWRKVKRYGLEK